MSPIAPDRSPRFASKDDAGHRFYTWGGESYYSVTTIIGGGIPKYLVAWASKAVADLVLTDLTAHGRRQARTLARDWQASGRSWVALLKEAGELKTIDLAKLAPEEFAQRWLKGAPDRIRDKAAELGSDVHSEAEALVLANAREASRLVLQGRPLPAWDERLASHMGSFVSWVDDWRPAFVAAEATVFNRAEAYAGTLDAIIRIPTDALLEALGGAAPDWLEARPVADWPEWVTLIVDYKSGRAVYPEVALQLAAYRRAEFIAGADGITELPLPDIDGGAVLHLTPRGYTFRLVDCGPGAFESFRFAREVYRWAIDRSRTALGPILRVHASQEGAA